MDAIIASGVLPGDLTGRDFTGDDAQSHNWTYQRTAPGYGGHACLGAMGRRHGCNGGVCGSWWYDWNYGSPGDNSASQWPAIGMLPAQKAPWNVIVPQWVKTYNANWLEYSKFRLWWQYQPL